VAENLKGNPVEIGDGHAAVIGNETCQIHCPEASVELSRRDEGWEGARRPAGHKRPQAK